MKDYKKVTKECCFDQDEILKCLCELDKELECIKHAFGHNKYFSRVAKEKVLFCILLREIGNIEKKLDKILRELDCGWTTDGDSDSDCGCD